MLWSCNWTINSLIPQLQQGQGRNLKIPMMLRGMTMIAMEKKLISRNREQSKLRKPKILCNFSKLLQDQRKKSLNKLMKILKRSPRRETVLLSVGYWTQSHKMSINRLTSREICLPPIQNLSCHSPSISKQKKKKSSISDTKWQWTPLEIIRNANKWLRTWPRLAAACRAVHQSSM